MVILSPIIIYSKLLQVTMKEKENDMRQYIYIYMHIYIYAYIYIYIYIYIKREILHIKKYFYLSYLFCVYIQ